MNFEINKIIGCIGAFLIVLSIFTPTIVFGPIAFIGIILVLTSLYGLAKFYEDKEIFSNALYGALSAVIGIIITLTIIVVTPVWSTLNEVIYQKIPDWNGNWLSLLNSSRWGTIFKVTWSQCAVWILLAFIVFWVFLIITMIFMRWSMDELAEYSQNNTFATIGTLLVISAIIPIIGLIGIWISTLMFAFALFTIKKPTLPVPSTASNKTNFCTNCGAPISSKTTSCTKCGKQIEE
jgi:uncharacterized membrane protein/ribosomal protein L40E